jgi:hypothetical protein
MPHLFAIPFGSLQQADTGHHHVVAYDTHDFSVDLDSLLNAAPASPIRITKFDGTSFNKHILAVAFEKLKKRDIEKEELRRSIERHGHNTGPAPQNPSSRGVPAPQVV